MAHIVRTEYDNFGFQFLPEILDWIRDNLKPDQIWTDDQLITMLVNEMDGAWKELVNLINENFDPEDIFDREKLHKWAIEELGLPWRGRHGK